MKQWFRVALVADLADCPRAVTVNGMRLIVYRVEGHWRAISGMCSHRGWPLNAESLIDGKLTCPLHGGRFDPSTGQAIRPPARVPLSCFAAAVVDGVLLVEMDSGGSESQRVDVALTE